MIQNTASTASSQLTFQQCPCMPTTQKTLSSILSCSMTWRCFQVDMFSRCGKARQAGKEYDCMSMISGDNQAKIEHMETLLFQPS